MPAFIESNTAFALRRCTEFGVYFPSVRIQAQRSVGPDRFEIEILDDGA